MPLNKRNNCLHSCGNVEINLQPNEKLARLIKGQHQYQLHTMCISVDKKYFLHYNFSTAFNSTELKSSLVKDEQKVRI